MVLLPRSRGPAVGALGVVVVVAGVVLRLLPPTPQRRIGRGGEVPPPPSSRAPSLCPATVPRTPGASLNGTSNRQKPPPNRFGNLLQPPA